jgi:predicted DNA-binding protein
VKIDQGGSEGPVRHLSLYVPSKLHARVDKAATAAGVHIAPWLRHMVRHISMADFPASWREGQAEERSHDSRTYGKRYMMRLDEPTQQKLKDLSTHFDTSSAEVIRELVAQARIEDFPHSWQLRATERRAQQARQGS